MATIHRIRTDFEQRIHIEQDVDASVLDCFLVALPPYTASPGMVVHRTSANMNDLFREAVAWVAYFKAQPWDPILPPSHFQPFGIITARNFEDAWREIELRRELMLGGVEPGIAPEDRARMERDPLLHENGRAHELRVASLIRAHDLLSGKEQMPVAKPLFALSGSKLN